MKHFSDQTFLPFEQSICDTEQAQRDAEIAAKAAECAAREAAKEKEEREKDSRRRQRAEAYRIRNTVQWAVCGIRCYNRNVYSPAGWTNCTRCGAPLRYFDTMQQAEDDAKANNRECKRS